MKEETVNEFGMTAKETTEMLRAAVGMNNMETLQLFLDRLSVDNKTLDKKCLNEVLGTAALGGHNDAIKLLVNRGADDLNGAMAVAAYYREADTVMLLRNLGASDFSKALNRAEGEHTIGLLRFYLDEQKRQSQATPRP